MSDTEKDILLHGYCCYEFACSECCDNNNMMDELPQLYNRSSIGGHHRSSSVDMSK